MSSTAAAQLTTPQCPAVPRVVRRPSTCNDKTYLWHSAAWNSSNSSVPPKRTAHLNGPEASILGPASDLLAAGLPFTGLPGLDSNMAACSVLSRPTASCVCTGHCAPSWPPDLSRLVGRRRRTSCIAPRASRAGMRRAGMRRAGMRVGASWFSPQDASTEWSTERAS